MGKRIVYIDDEPQMVDMIHLALSMSGYEVSCADNGPDGLKLIRSQKPDLVILDLMLPGVDGWEIYRQMKTDAKIKHIPVIVVTANALGIDRWVGLKIAHVDDYLVKPFTPKELNESVEKVLNATTVEWE
jgi:DNA-binding response OmpR family regulator